VAPEAGGALPASIGKGAMAPAAPDEEEPGSSPLAFEHLDPMRPILHGAAMGAEFPPVTFALATVPEELTRYLREDPDGPFAAPLDPWPKWMGDDRPWRDGCPLTDGRWSKWGFQFSPKEPFMLKADWHCVHEWGHAHELFVPRMDGSGPVRRAPPRILAFAEAFRQKNAACWSRIAQALVKLRAEVSRSDRAFEGLAQIFIDHIQRCGLLGVIEAQASPASGPHSMRPHQDGASSLLHLGLTLGGRRRLKSQFTKSAPSCATSGGWVETNLTAGSAYLSSPFLFEHAVQYEQEPRDGPIFALMCRFAFTEQEAFAVNQLRDRRMARVARVVSEGLGVAASRGELRLPSLEEVLQAEERTRLVRAPMPSALSGALREPGF